MEYDYLFFSAILGLIAFISWVAWRNSLYYSQKAHAVAEQCKVAEYCVEKPDAEHERIKKMTLEEYEAEREKGKIRFDAGMEIKGIAEGLKSPFRVWR